MLNEALNAGGDSGADAFAVRVQLATGPRIAASLTTLDSKRAVVRVTAQSGIQLALGSKTRLFFDSPRLRQTVVIAARLSQRESQPVGEVWTFRLIDEGTEINRLIREALASIYNRRSTYRVAPGGTLKARLDHESFDAPYEVKLDSLSMGGLGLRIPCEHEEVFAAVDRLAVRLTLPGEARELAFECRIANRRLTNASYAIYGLEFEPRATTGPEPAVAPIVAYVMNRQQELLSKASA